MADHPPIVWKTKHLIERIGPLTRSYTVQKLTWNRLGQKLNVNIFKLTIEKTVEDRECEVSQDATLGQILNVVGILDLQHAKREIAAAALSGEGAKNVMKLTLNDIMGKSMSSMSSVERANDHSSFVQKQLDCIDILVHIIHTLVIVYRGIHCPTSYPPILSFHDQQCTLSTP